MRPRRLTISAFGPFAGTVEADFTLFEGRDLFLIEGPTGAGKTSILDAMTYALFGAVPGARHEVESELRSAFAESHAICEVTFEFSLGERVYRARRRPGQERARKRGAGKVVQKPDAHLYEVVDGVERPVCQPKVFEVDAAVQRLLGLSVEQFKQVLLLPQGEFREFLLARSNDKEALLEKLFGTSLYKDVAERLGAEKRALERRCLDLSKLQAELFHQRGVDSQDALEIAAAQAAAEVEAATVLAERDGAAAQRAWQRHAQAAALATQVAARARARTVLAEAEAAHAAAGPARRALVDAERAAPVAAALALVAREAERGERLAVELARAAEAVAQATRDGAHVDVRAAGLPARRSELEQLAGQDAILAALEPVAAEREQARAEHAAAQRRHKAQAERLAAIDASEAQRRAAQASLGERLATSLAAAEPLLALNDAATAARARADRRRELAEAEARHLHARQLHDEKHAQVLGQRTQVESARAAMERRREAREANLAAELAQVLRDGSPCPVCGASAHPAPARASADAVSSEHVAEGERNYAAQAQRLARFEAELSALAADVSTRAERAREIARALGEPLEPLDAALRAAEAAVARRDAAQAAATAATGLARERDVHAAELERLRIARREVGDQLALAVAELEAVTTRGKQLGARLADALPAGASLPDARAQLAARRDAALADIRALEDALERSARALTDARARHGQLVDQAAEQARVLAEARAGADAAARTHGFADAAEVARHLLPTDDMRRRRDELTELDRRRTQARDRLVDADAALAGADIAALADAADVAARAAERATAERFAAAASERLGNARAQAAELGRAAAVSRARAAEQRQLEAELLTLGHLSRVCAGDNPLKMSLGRYVLAARMEEVAVAASERLFAMSRGRYRLRRTDEVRHAGRGSGLDLVVDDSLTGSERSVHSLSGGEMFMASLSLAMGLADVVQAHAGGIRLDSLFIDEGFGTLDDDTLDQVMHTLGDLRAGGRLIGLISHVHELRERLSTRVSVVKGARGSTLRLVV